MKKNLFLTAWAVIFSLLVTVQGYYALHEDASKEFRAHRIGAIFTDWSDLGAFSDEAHASFSGLSAYLTMETLSGAASNAILLINGTAAGNFERGVLTVRVANGDRLALENGEGETIVISDYPDGMDELALPSRVEAEKTATRWGVVSFK